MTGSIVTRLFRVAFGFYVIVAIILNILLVVREYVDTKATIQRELEMYQGVFDSSLASALWAMDIDKLDAIAGGIVAIPEITALRVTDPVNGHLFVSAFNRDGAIAIDHDGRTRAPGRKWRTPRDRAATASTSSTTTKPAAALSDMPNSSRDGGHLIDQIKGQTILIIGIAVLKEAALWVIFLIVGRRILSRPLTALIRAMDATTPENPTPIAWIDRLNG